MSTPGRNIIIPGYCDGCHKIRTHKNLGNKYCSVYEDVCRKTRTVGCAFSPMERPKPRLLTKKRIGQQKQKRGDK